MEFTHDVWRFRFETRLAALHWTFSMELINLIFSAGIPDCGCILKYRSNKGLVYSFLCLLVADLEVAPEEAKCLVGFVGNGVDMGAPVLVVLGVDTKVLCGGDVFNGMSMQLI